MARPSTILVILIVGMNLTVIMLGSAGVWTLLGVDSPNPQVDGLDAARGQTEQVNTGNALGGTLFAMYNSLGQGAGTLFQVAFGAPILLARVGVAGYITDFIGGIIAFIITFDIMSYIRGWGL